MIAYFSEASKILVFLINVFGLAIAISVFNVSFDKILKRIFLMMTILMFVWVDCAFLARVIGNPESSVYLIRIAWAITPLLFILVYSFIVNLLGQQQRYKIFTFSSYILGEVSMFGTLLTSFVIKSTFYENGILKIMYGKLVWIFFGLVTMYTLINFYLLISNYINKNTKPEIKRQLKILLFGLTIFFTANAIFNIYFPVFRNTFHLYEFGDYSTIVFISLIAYAVVWSNFFNIKIVGAVFVSVLLGSFLLVDTFIFSSNFTQVVIKSLVFIIYIPFGYSLVRSVLREVKQRQQLEELNNKLRELDKQKDEFVSMAAHELRSPLTAIKGYVSMIIEGDTGDIPEKARQYLADSMAVTDRLVRLVNNMLNVSRIEEGRLVYQMEDTHLIRAVQEIYYSYRIEAERKGIKFMMTIPNGLEDLVYVDPDRIREVIGNLVSNAVKFTEKGKIEIRMGNPRKGIVRVDISDTGPGITEEEQKKLFVKFYRAESTAGKTFGTGLGLYITKLLIDNFGGVMGLESEIDKGTTFWFELPVKH